MPPARQSPSNTASTIFVDREEPKRTFEKAVFAIPAKGCILRTWYGVGGQGKTALARELFRISDPEIEPSFKYLRRVMLDLHGRPKSDPDRLLVWIRNGFAKAGVATPAFDLAFAIMWQKTRGDETLPNFENPWLHRSGEALTDSIPETVTITREFLESFAETIPGLSFLVKRGTRWAFDSGKKVWLERTREHLRMLYRDGGLIEDYEISALMPWMLAQDLNQHLRTNRDDRFVLFVDEYESVFEGAGTGSRWQENPFDERMRRFIAETDALLAIFFSRERLPWENNADWREDLDGNQHLLGGLSDVDADRWLLKLPIEDADIRKALVEGSRETPVCTAPIYPLMLDLQIEHWRNLGSKAKPSDFQVEETSFEARRKMLVERLLRDYDDAIQNLLKRMALPLRFDRSAFEYVVERANIPLSFDAFDRLADLSIVTRDEDGWLSLHRAIADAIIFLIDERTLEQARQSLLDHFAKRSKPERVADVDTETLSCFSEAARLRLQQGVGGYVQWLIKYQEKISIAARSIYLEYIWREALYEVLHKISDKKDDICLIYSNIAVNLDAQGRYEEAEPHFRKALEIAPAVFGDTHPETGTSYDNLAGNLTVQGRYEEAEPLHREALKIRRAALGEAHPDTGASYNNIAQNLDAQGLYKEAESLHREALKIRRAALGEAHPDTGISYDLVASNLHSQGLYEEAEPLFRKGLDIRCSALGELHSDTGASYNNIAHNLDAQGRYEEAEPLYRKALKIFRTTLGERHPSVGTSYNNIASNLGARGLYEEAEPLFRKGLEIRRSVLGETHFDTGTSYNNIASNLDAQGRYKEAELLHHKALEIFCTSLGEGHPDTGTGYNNLAGNLGSQGRYEEAEPLFRKALGIRLATLGKMHPATGASYDNLAGCLGARGLYEEAEPLHCEALKIFRATLGEMHPSTGTSYNIFAVNLDAQGRYEEAEPLFRKCLEITRAALGEVHPRTGKTIEDIAINLSNQSRFEEADALYQQAIVIIQDSMGEDHPWTQRIIQISAENKRAIGIRAFELK